MRSSLSSAGDDVIFVVESDPRPGPRFEVQGANHERQAPRPDVPFLARRSGCQVVRPSLVPGWDEDSLDHEPPL